MPEDDEGDDITRVLCPVQQASAALVELLITRNQLILPVSSSLLLPPF